MVRRRTCDSGGAELPGACRWLGVLSAMKALDVLSTEQSEDYVEQVAIGALGTPHWLAKVAGTALQSFVELLRKVPASSHAATFSVEEFTTQDESYNTAFVSLTKAGVFHTQPTLIREHCRRKRLFMLCQHAPVEAVLEFWRRTSMDDLKDMVPDASKVLSGFDPRSAASLAADLFGFERTTGPLFISCFGCLFRPVAAQIDKTFRGNKNKRRLSVEIDRYRASQKGVPFVCNPCPAVLFSKAQALVATPRKHGADLDVAAADAHSPPGPKAVRPSRATGATKAADQAPKVAPAKGTCDAKAKAQAAKVPKAKKPGRSGRPGRPRITTAPLKRAAKSLASVSRKRLRCK